MHLFSTFLVIAIFAIIHIAQGHHAFDYNIPDKPLGGPENSDSKTSLSVSDLKSNKAKHLKFSALFGKKQPTLDRSTEMKGVQNGGPLEQANDSRKHRDMSFINPQPQPLEHSQDKEGKRKGRLGEAISWQSTQFTTDPVASHEPVSPIKENTKPQKDNKLNKNLRNASHYYKQYNKESNNKSLPSGLGNQAVTSSLNDGHMPKHQSAKSNTYTSRNLAENGRLYNRKKIIANMKQQTLTSHGMLKHIEMATQFPQTTSNSMKYNNHHNIGQNQEQVEWNNKYNHKGAQNINFNNGKIEPCDMPLVQLPEQPKGNKVKSEENLGGAISWQSTQFTTDPVSPQESKQPNGKESKLEETLGRAISWQSSQLITNPVASQVSPINENTTPHQENMLNQNMKDSDHYYKQYNKESYTKPLLSNLGNQAVTSSLNDVLRPRPQNVKPDTPNSSNFAENSKVSTGTLFIDKFRQQQLGSQGMMKPNIMKAYNNYPNIRQHPKEIEWNNEYIHNGAKDTNIGDGKTKPWEMSLVQPLEQPNDKEDKTKENLSGAISWQSTQFKTDSVSSQEPPINKNAIPQHKNMPKQDMKATSQYYKQYNKKSNNKPIAFGLGNQAITSSLNVVPTPKPQDVKSDTHTSNNLAENDQLSTLTHFVDNKKHQQINSQIPQITSSNMQVFNNYHNVGQNPNQDEWNNKYHYDSNQDSNVNNDKKEPCDVSLIQPPEQPKGNNVKSEDNLGNAISWQSTQFTTDPVSPLESESPFIESIPQQDNISKQNIWETPYYYKQYNTESDNQPITSSFGNQMIMSQVLRPNTQTSTNLAENNQMSTETLFIDDKRQQLNNQSQQITSSNTHIGNNNYNIAKYPSKIDWNNKHNHDAAVDGNFNDGKAEPCDVSLVHPQEQPEGEEVKSKENLGESISWQSPHFTTDPVAPQETVSPIKDEIIPQTENIIKPDYMETPYYYKQYNKEPNNEPSLSGLRNQMITSSNVAPMPRPQDMRPNIQTSTNLQKNNQMFTGTHFIDDKGQQQLNSPLPQLTSSFMPVNHNNHNIGQTPSNVEWNNEYNHDGTQYINKPYKGDLTAIPGQPDADYPIYSKIPNTTFRCDKQQFPGYYADVETRCQVFHVCYNGLLYDFLCPNGTIFHQKYLVCVWWNQFDCNSAPSLYETNANIFKEMIKNSYKPTETNSKETNPIQPEATTTSTPCETNQHMDQRYEITTGNSKTTNINYEYKNGFNTELPHVATGDLGTFVPKSPTPKEVNQWSSLPSSKYLTKETYSEPQTRYTGTYNPQEFNKVSSHSNSQRSREMVIQNTEQSRSYQEYRGPSAQSHFVAPTKY